MDINILKENVIDVDVAKYGHKEADIREGKQRYLACMFIISEYSTCYKVLKTRLDNAYLMGK